MRCTRTSRSALVVVAAVVLVASCGSGEKDGALLGTVRRPLLRVADVRLPRAGDDGAPMAMRAPSGQLLLVYFGYTSCPDICPTTMSDISVALHDLPAAVADRVTVAMATVDPERDSAEKLTEYLRHFFSRSIPLRTDDPATLKTAAEAFGVQYEVEQHEVGASYAVGHSAFTYVVDDTGTVVVEWPFGFESADMAHDITTIMNKEQA